MRSILVPINFSKGCINALRTSLDIAQQTNSRVILLNNMDEAGSGTVGPDTFQDQPISGYWNSVHKFNNFSERLEYLRGLRIQYHVPKLKMEFMVVKNLTGKQFEQLVREKEIRIIVAGLEEVHSSSDFLLESMKIDGADINIPMLCVDVYHAHLRYNKILLIDDIGSPDHEFAKLVKTLGSALGSKVYVTTYLASGKSLVKSWPDAERVSSTADLESGESEFVSDSMPLQDLDLHDLAGSLKVDLAASTKSLTENLGEFDDLDIHEIHRAGSLRVPQLV